MYNLFLNVGCMAVSQVEVNDVENLTLQWLEHTIRFATPDLNHFPSRVKFINNIVIKLWLHVYLFISR